MMKFPLAVLCLLLSLAVQAQTNYKTGYIVKSTGDTLRGSINYKEWAKNPRSIEFKNNLSDLQAELYTPVMLQCFVIDGIDKYVSYSGPLSTNSYKFPDIPYEVDTTKVIDTVFLHVSYQGSPLSLLKHEDRKRRFFVSENGQAPVELNYYTFYTNNGLNTRELRSFVEQLSIIADRYGKNNNEFEGRSTRSGYNETDLQKLIQFINNDRMTKTTGTSGHRFFVGALLDIAATKFSGINEFVGQTSIDILPRVSGGIDFFPNIHTQHTAFRVEMGLMAIRPRFQMADRFYTRTYKFDQYTLSVTPQIIWNLYNEEAFKFHVGVGASLNISAYANDGGVEARIGGAASTTKPIVYKHETFWYSLPVQVGITLNKQVQLCALYKLPANYTNYNDFSISSQSFGIGIKYYLGK